MRSLTDSGRTIHLINAGLLVLLFVGSALVWPGLPGEIPAHFDASGRVTSWSPASVFSWFAIPISALALTALNYLLARLLPRWPRMINVPDKQQFLALSSERRSPVIQRVRELLYGTSALLNVLMIAIQIATYKTAHGARGDGYILAILIGSVLLTPLILGLWLPPIQAEIDRQSRHDDAGPSHR